MLTEILPKYCLNPPEKSEFCIKDYECYIPSFTAWRGVAIYIYESLESILIEPLTLSNFSESVWCSIRLANRERSGSVVECLTRDRRAAGSSLTGVTALWSLSKTHLS